MKGSIDKIVEAGDRCSKKTCWVIHTVNGVIQLRDTQNQILIQSAGAKKFFLNPLCPHSFKTPTSDWETCFLILLKTLGLLYHFCYLSDVLNDHCHFSEEVFFAHQCINFSINLSKKIASPMVQL